MISGDWVSENLILSLKEGTATQLLLIIPCRHVGPVWPHLLIFQKMLKPQTSTDPQGEHHGQQANTLLAATHITSLLKTSQEQHLHGEQPRQLLGLLHGEGKVDLACRGFQPARG